MNPRQLYPEEPQGTSDPDPEGRQLSAPVQKVTCLCGAKEGMVMVADAAQGIIYDCPTCNRMLWRSKVCAVQRWFVPVDEGVFTLTQAKEMACQTCGEVTVHIRYLTGPWRCLKCRIREGERELKKEGG
jgi:predicted RNA-binding Zn-ribbon protein involved in translation (DUF1610 family)